MTALTDDKIAQIQEAAKTNRADQIGVTLGAAAEVSPDAAPELISLQKEFNVPFGTVERNTATLLEMRDRNKVAATDMVDRSPGTAAYLSSRENALVSSDDTETLSALESAVSTKVPFWDNNLRRLFDATNMFTGNAISLLGAATNALETGTSALGIPTPVLSTNGLSFEMNPRSGDKLKEIGQSIANENVYGSKANFTWENFKGEMTPTNLGGYIIEQTAGSIPEMAAAMLSFPLYVASMSSRLAYDRAANNGDEDVTLTDMAMMLPAAIATGLLDRLGGRASLGWDTAAGTVIGKAGALRAVGRAATIEGGTEFLQESNEYLATTLGTDKPVNLFEMLDRGIAGAVAGAGMGGTFRTPSAISEAVNNASAQREVRRFVSRAEQQQLDAIITLAQSSTTNGRAKASMTEFMNGVSDNDVVYLAPEVFEKLGPEVELPGFLQAKRTDSTQDVAIPMAQFVTEIASNPELVTALRPFLRRSVEGMTQGELKTAESVEIERLVKRANKDEKLHTEAKEVFKSVEAKLKATNLFSPEESRTMASIYPAMATVAASERGISIADAYARMGLTVLNTDVQAAKETGAVLEQARNTGYEGDSTGEAAQWVAATKKFGKEGMTPEARLARAQEMGFDTGRVLYHGTRAQGEAFDKLRTNENSGNVMGAYLTYDPEYASKYTKTDGAQVGAVYPVYVRGNIGTRADIDSMISDIGQSSTAEEKQKYLIDKGLDGVNDEMMGEVVVFDPSNIRSVNAAFDPDATESTDILAQGALRNAPGPVNIPGRGVVEFEPLDVAITAAKAYSLKAGIPYVEIEEYAPVDPARAAKVATEYEMMKHDPSDPLVQKAYAALIDETLAQFETILDTGITFDFIKGEDPYKESPRLAILDIKENNHLWVFSTRDGFGSNAEFDPKDNPLLAETKYEINGQKLLANDVFRIVHDYFGHAKTGVGFRASGEENAWQSHAAMYSPLARRAMTTETRGQNSWVNYGPHGETNRTASTEDTVFADQKTGLLPVWVSEEGKIYEEKPKDTNGRSEDGALIRPPIKNGRIKLTHFSRRDGIQRLNPAFYGSNFAGAERARTGSPFWRDRTYFGIEPGTKGGYRHEAKTGSTRYETSIGAELMYDFAADPDGLRPESKDPSEYEAAIMDAGYSGFWVKHPALGMVAATFDPLIVESRNGRPERNVLYQSAYHGSPYRFDRFSLAAIGTGEGAQAYGWGLYFAQKRDVAEYYRDQLTDPDLARLLSRRGALRASYSPVPPELDAKIAELEAAGSAKGGLYKVDVPEDSELLMWDEPLSKQPETVRTALAKMGPESLSGTYQRQGLKNILDLFEGRDITGNQLMRALRTELRGEKEASLYLGSLGVPGLRFLDGESRFKSYRQLREEFQDALPDDASIEDVLSLLEDGGFSDVNAEIIRQLQADDWLGFDYPAQAISAALRGDGYFEMSRELQAAIEAARGQGTYNYVIWDEDRVTVEAVNDEVVQAQEQLAQDDRASIELANNDRIIRLSQASDLSSFLHESAHLFLDFEKQMAKEFGVTARQQKTLDWLGATSFDELDPSTPRGVALHEKFAEGFETYLYEGKAPSLELRDMFAAFARWLRQVYRAISPYSALNDEGRQVFDAMLATEAQIEAAASSGIYEELFSSKKEAGMTDAEWESYQNKAKRRKEIANETLDEKVLRQLRARRTKEWREDRAPLVEEERARLSELPVYQAIAAMREYPMDSAAVKALFEGQPFPPRLKPRVKKDGVDPAEYAEQFGWPSAEAMLKEMIDTPNLDAAAMAAAEARMVETHGDILNDGTIEAEARDAVSNGTHAELLYDEAAALARKMSKPAINRELLKAQAAQAVSKMNTTEVEPGKFYRAEIKAAVKAAKAKTPEAKLKAQIQRLANHYLFVEATAAQKDALRYQAYLKGVQTRNYDTRVVDAGYVNAMKQLVNMYDFRAKPTKRRQRALRMYDWYKGQAEAGVILMDNNLAAFAEAINDGISDTYVFPTMNELTMEDLRSTYDMARHLRFKGGKIAQQATQEVEAERAELLAGMNDTARRVDPPEDQPNEKLENKAVWSHLMNTLPTLRNMVRNLDGFSKDDFGPWAKWVYSRVAEGTALRLDLAKEFYGNFKSELEAISELGIYRGEDTKRTIDKEQGGTLTLDRVGRFMLAAYWGTESSREAIRQGHNVTNADVERMLSLMTPAELEAVNGLWRANETMWPKLSEAALKRDGVAPPKLTPTPFQVNGVTLTGGHMRLIYEDHADEIRDANTRLDYVNSIIPSKAASAMARVGSGGKRVRLDSANIFRAIDDNIHFIAFSEIGTRLQALVNNKDIKAAMVATRGEGFQRAFTESITGLVTNAKEREVMPGLAKIANWARHAKSSMYLAYNIKNIFQQIGALPQALDEVGAMDFMSNLSRMMYDRRKFMEEVNEMSPQMRDRAEKITREHAEVTKRQMFNSKQEQAWNKFIQHGFTPHVLVDMVVSYPVWRSKYNSEMLAHGDQKRAIVAADVAVAESVGSGLDLNMGKAVQSNQGALVKLMTIFASWFNSTTYQRMYRDTKGGSEFTSSRAFMSLVLIPVFSAVTAAVVAYDLPDTEGGGDEEFWKWLALRYASFASATLPLIRDGVGLLLQGFTPQTPIQDLVAVPKAVVDLGTRAAGGEMTAAKAASSTLRVAGTVLPLPGSGNVVRMLDYIDSYQQGNEPDRSFPGHLLHGFVEGPDRNRVE